MLLDADFIEEQIFVQKLTLEQGACLCAFQKNKYVCHICSKELSCKATLRAHVRAHSGE